MQLTLVRDDTLIRLPLPKKKSGQYWVTYPSSSGKLIELMSVEGVDDSWILKSNRGAWLVDAEQLRIREAALEPNRFYEVHIAVSGEHVLLRSEPTTDDRQIYSKYVLPENGRLRIGRAEGSDIRFESSFVSSRHAEFVIQNGEISVEDLSSSNGTFVNSQRISTISLKPGDLVSVVGLNIVVGHGFLAINNPDGLVTTSESSLAPFIPPGVRLADDEDWIEESSPEGLFFRSPRFKRDITTAQMRIDSPPQPESGDETPLMMVLGPALTMGMASLFMGIFAVTNVMSSPGGDITQALPTLIMSLSMMLGMILWPILSKRYDKKRRIAKEIERHEKYRAYIERMRTEIESEREHQSQVLCENIVTVEDCAKRVRARERSLWERTTDHNDFARVRLGVGDWPLAADIRYDERRFSVEEDELKEEMFALAEEPKVLHGVPVSVSLREQPVVGLIGERVRTRDVLRRVVVQLAALHSYDELKLVFIIDPSETEVWDYASVLPHVWADDRSLRLMATNQSEARALSSYLDGILGQRQASAVGGTGDSCPHYVVFALSKDLAGKAEVLNKLLALKGNTGFSLVTLYDELHNLPKECAVVIEVDAELSKIYDKDDVSGEYLAFTPDTDPLPDVRALAESLANTRLEAAAGSFVLPDVVTFLELFGVGKVEHLNPLARWKESNPVHSLAAPVGVDTSGEAFQLDLHEKFHGPHGLIAGMTGSGKSEFIMTYILSMAVTYDPSEVAFVLIDYKGGGMANTFANLPHVAGTITNLDGAAVNRSLVSIQSELKRRQAIFNSASEATGTSNVDIYKYQSLYRDGAVAEPLPHLLIISDEFAELKTQQPDFMAQLVSAARIGRSLGVHLILATQKPSGVVDDQIWSNSRFRVCLKVQETADSMEVIKRPDAAALAGTGRFYVQVGFNELFELGQSAWAGAPYYPSENVDKPFDDSVVLLNNLGQPVRQKRVDRRSLFGKNPPKQIDEVTTFLAELAAEENAGTRRLWLDPIPEIIVLDDLKTKYPRARVERNVLNPVVGEYDDPANQHQMVMTVPVSADGGLIIYGSAGSGKTTLLTTLVYSLIDSYTPDELNLYLLDFGSETLRAFRQAPHVGDVVFSHDAEKVANLMGLLADEVKRRKRLFADYGGDYSSYVTESGQALPSIVVAINNYAAFAETYEDLEGAVAYLTREGTKYGVYFILTAASASAVRYRVAQNFKQLLVLQQNDPTEYAGILGNTQGVVPSPLKGRGIFKSDRVYEFQTARVSAEEGGELAFIRKHCAEFAQSWTGAPARRIPVLPESVTPEFFSDEIGHSTAGVLPVGVDKKTLRVITYDFRKPFISLVLSMDGAAAVAQGLAEAIAQSGKANCTVIDSESSFVDDPSRGYDYLSDADEINATVAALFDEMLERNHSAAQLRGSGEGAPEFDPAIYVIEAATEFLGRLSSNNREKFAAMLEKCDASLGINFVLFDSAANLSSISFEPWLKAHVTPGGGIWVGDGFTDQYVLTASSTSSELYEPIGKNFGYVLAKGKPRLVKLLTSATADLGGDADE